MLKPANRLSSGWMVVSAFLFVAFIAFDATPASAQSRSEVVDPFSNAPRASRTELLDPFVDAPRRARSAGTAPRTTDLLDPFAATARCAAHYVAELLDPWSD